VIVAFSYLLDENLHEGVGKYLALHYPDLPVHSMGRGIAPPKSTLDDEVLLWCELNGSVLVTDNRKSMPGHLADHLASGRHVEGIFEVGSMTITALGDHLVEVAQIALPGEFRDLIRVLPLY